MSCDDKGRKKTGGKNSDNDFFAPLVVLETFFTPFALVGEQYRSKHEPPGRFIDGSSFLEGRTAVCLKARVCPLLARSLGRASFSFRCCISHLLSLFFLFSLNSPTDSIINPEAPLALRLSGQLLLGVVKIYSRKVGYLYSDCNDAVARIAASLSRGGGGGAGGGAEGPDGDVDLPEDERDATAVIASITLPEGTSGCDVAVIVAALNAGGSITGGGRFFGNGGAGNGNNSALDAFAASIELGGAANFSLTGDSFLIAEEVSTLLPSSMHPGGGNNNGFDPASAGGNGVRFALSGRDIERALSGSAGAPFTAADNTFVDDGDVETLRDASALPDRLPPASGLFGDDGTAGAGNQSMATKMFTEGMEPPPYYDDDDNGGGGFGGGGGDDDDEDGYRGLTPNGGGGLPPTPLDGGDGSPALVGTAALLAASGGRPLRRKRPRLDVTEDGRGAPKTQLVNIDIRRLLQDPSPLMRIVESAAGAAGFASTGEYGAALADLLVSNAAAARARKERADRGRALLARPTFAPFMAPELFDAVVRCAPPPAAAAPRKPRSTGNDNAGAAAGGEDLAAAGPSAAFNDGGYNDDDGAWAGGGGGFDDDDDDEDDYAGGGGFGGIDGDAGGEERLGGVGNANKADDNEDAAGGPSPSSAHSAAITRRTRAALDRFQGEWGSDAARGNLSAARPVSLAAVTAGATRLDAARWFFEVLVLRSRGFVDVAQERSYGDVEVRPRAMAFDEGVLGALAGNGSGAAAVAV